MLNLPNNEPRASTPASKPLWKAAAGACFKALLSASSGAPNDAPGPLALQARLAGAIALDDDAQFERLIALAPPMSSVSGLAAVALRKTLELALWSDSPRYLDGLLAAGIDPNADIGLGPAIRGGLLRSACAKSRPGAVALLLSRGADPALPDAQGRSALLLAAAAGCHQSVAALINAKAPLDALDAAGQSALDAPLHGFPSQDPMIEFIQGALADPRLRPALRFARPLAAKARVARLLLIAGAEFRQPLPLLALAIRLRDQRLFDALAARGVGPDAIPFRQAADAALAEDRLAELRSPQSPVAWARYLRLLAEQDGQIADFMEQAQDAPAPIPAPARARASPAPSRSEAALLRPRPPAASAPAASLDALPQASGAPRNTRRILLPATPDNPRTPRDPL